MGRQFLGWGPAIPVLNDVWFIYTAKCLGTVTFSLCNADFDESSSSTMREARKLSTTDPDKPHSRSDDAAGCG